MPVLPRKAVRVTVGFTAATGRVRSTPKQYSERGVSHVALKPVSVNPPLATDWSPIVTFCASAAVQSLHVVPETERMPLRSVPVVTDARS